jgi:hypothetical protein
LPGQLLEPHGIIGRAWSIVWIFTTKLLDCGNQTIDIDNPLLDARLQGLQAVLAIAVSHVRVANDLGEIVKLDYAVIHGNGLPTG